jgi:threonine dehydrogenase-like Zn-dependent dehydrogenase
VETSAYASAGKRRVGDQSPERRGGEVASKLNFDLARVDGMAGVRGGHESMGDVIEVGEVRGG